MSDTEDNVVVDPTELTRFVHGNVKTHTVSLEPGEHITRAIVLYSIEDIDGKFERFGYVGSDIDMVTTLGMIHAARLYCEGKINHIDLDED